VTKLACFLFFPIFRPKAENTVLLFLTVVGEHESATVLWKAGEAGKRCYIYHIIIVNLPFGSCACAVAMAMYEADGYKVGPAPLISSTTGTNERIDGAAIGWNQTEHDFSVEKQGRKCTIETKTTQLMWYANSLFSNQII